MMEKRIGNIESVRFGTGGYQDCQLGLGLTFLAGGYGVGTFIGDWNLKRSDTAKWTEQDRREGFADLMWKISDLLRAANVDDVYKLKGVPVELTFDGNMLKDWRILAEVVPGSLPPVER
jgi:hypothetical protein